MKKILLAAFFATWSLAKLQAQDVDINIISQENGVNDGVWALAPLSTTSSILVTICNNDPGVRAVPQNKLRPLISVPGAICQINAVQPGLPAGWTIVSNTGSSIRLCNGTDSWAPGECREFSILVTPTASGGPLTVTATMAWANGISCGTSGPQTIGNQVANDNSTTAIQVLPNATLPINLEKFEGNVNMCQTTLNWKVSQDSNSDEFEIEQSSDGVRFSKAGQVSAASGSQNYSLKIPHPGGRIFYRLKMKDLDAKVTYSQVISITSVCGGDQVAFKVYPNPVVSSSFKIEFGKAGKYELLLVNATGATVHHQQVVVNAGQVTEVNKVNFPPGTYFLRMKDISTGSEKSTKLVIQ